MTTDDGFSPTEPIEAVLRSLGVKSVPFFDALNRYGSPAYGVLVWLGDMIPFWPCGPAAFTSGALYGSREGLATAIVGQACAAISSFLLGRYILIPLYNHNRKCVGYLPNCLGGNAHTWKVHKKLQTILQGVEKYSFKQQLLTFCLIRQSPLIPFSISNYSIGGLTRVSIVPFFLGTLVGCLPGNVLIVGAGATARAGHTWQVDPASDPKTILGLVGLMATLGLLYMSRRLAAATEAQVKDDPKGGDQAQVVVGAGGPAQSIARKEEGRRRGESATAASPATGLKAVKSTKADVN